VGRVLFKTVFKGNEALEGKIVRVTIEGGDGAKESRGMARCLRKLREGDTRIFFYNLGPGGDEMGNQTSVPLPPALSVMAAVRNAVKGKTYISTICHILLTWFSYTYNQTQQICK
jgi:hypothetical protein